MCSMLVGGAGGMVLGVTGLIGGNTAGSKVYEHREGIKESFTTSPSRGAVREGFARVLSDRQLAEVWKPMFLDGGQCTTLRTNGNRELSSSWNLRRACPRRHRRG